MRYLRNVWYVAAWSDEIATGTSIARTLLDESVALFRDNSGKIQALRDRCPHRFAPLSKGVVVGDTLQCPYHGLRFDGGGQCQFNPHGDGSIPRAAKVTSYPVVDRHSAVWIWMGNPANADPSLIPDFGVIDPETNYVGKDYLSVKANYQLEADNIMDLGHIAFLHPDTLGNDVVRDAQTEVTQDKNTIWSKRQTYRERLPPALEAHYGSAPETLWDRWFDVRWDPPASMLLWVGSLPAGTQRTADSKAIPFIHLFTPETTKTTHYWFATSYPRSFGQQYEKRAARDIKFLRAPFEIEDLPMLQAQQEAMGDAEFWDLKPVLLATDAAAVRARRILDKLIKDERVANDLLSVPAASGCNA